MPTPIERDEYGHIQPTPLQHLAASLCAGILREMLSTKLDKEVVVAILLSAAQTEREDDEETYEASEELEMRRWWDMCDTVSHAVVLDMNAGQTVA